MPYLHASVNVLLRGEGGDKAVLMYEARASFTDGRVALSCLHSNEIYSPSGGNQAA